MMDKYYYYYKMNECRYYLLALFLSKAANRELRALSTCQVVLCKSRLVQS